MHAVLAQLQTETLAVVLELRRKGALLLARCLQIAHLLLQAGTVQQALCKRRLSATDLQKGENRA
jgi:hypothetical protein